MSEEEKLPNAELIIPECFKYRVSPKRLMLLSGEDICKSLTESNIENGINEVAKLILLVNGGIIKGIPASEEEYDVRTLAEIDGKVNLFYTGQMRNQSLVELEKENDINLVGTGSYICLKDATFTTGQLTINVPELIVFSEVVVGFSISTDD